MTAAVTLPCSLLPRSREQERPGKCVHTRERERHAVGCRPARPLCARMRLRRPNRRPCACAAYWFPHRSGGGACRDGIPMVVQQAKSWKERAA